MNKKGFTLIELLIVVVIIGILAAIAIPRFGQTRERAFVSAMQSDLRGVLNAQELYYQATVDGQPRYQYLTSGTLTPASDGGLTALSISPGVTIALSDNSPDGTTNQGFIARAGHNATETNCAVYLGPAVADGLPANTGSGVIVCGDGVTGPAGTPD